MKIVSQPKEESQEEIKPKTSWAVSERVKSDWIKPEVKYGSEVLAPNEQKSNNDFPEEMVLQARTEPIGASSQAKPLSPHIDRNTGALPAPPNIN